MKKESERLSQEVNQRDTNKLGMLLNLMTLFSNNLLEFCSSGNVLRNCTCILTLLHNTYLVLASSMENALNFCHCCRIFLAC